MQQTAKSVQIDIELFYSMLDYIIAHADRTDPTYQYIAHGVSLKLKKMLQHDHYTSYKTASTKEESKRAFNKYLDDIGAFEPLRF